MKRIERIPKDFVIKFLKAKGWKDLHEVWCGCSLDTIETSHPIKWLYDHVEKGHEPSFDCCHCWNRAVGRDTGVVEEWYRWFTFSWDRAKQDWIITDCVEGLEGFESKCPPWAWRR